MEPTIRTRAGRVLRSRLPALLGLSIFVAAGCDDAATDRLHAAAEARDAQAELRARAASTATPSDATTDTILDSPTPQATDPASTPEPAEATAADIAMGAGEPVTYATAEEAYTQGRYDEAVILFQAYSTRRPENPWGHYMTGLSAWKAGSLDEAEEALDEALRLDPGHVKSWVNLGRVLLEQGRTESAREKLERALELEPASGAALRVSGRALHDLGDVDGAATAYRRAIVADMTDAWSMNNLGLLLIQQGRFDDALRPLAVATSLREDVAVFHNNLGVALERTGHLGQAQEAYARALDLEERYERARVSLDRVAERRATTPDETLDLLTVATAFRTEVEEWRTALVDETPAEPETTTAAPDETPAEPEGGESVVPGGGGSTGDGDRPAGSTTPGTEPGANGTGKDAAEPGAAEPDTGSVEGTRPPM